MGQKTSQTDYSHPLKKKIYPGERGGYKYPCYSGGGGYKYPCLASTPWLVGRPLANKITSTPPFWGGKKANKKLKLDRNYCTVTKYKQTHKHGKEGGMKWAEARLIVGQKRVMCSPLNICTYMYILNKVFTI